MVWRSLILTLHKTFRNRQTVIEYKSLANVVIVTISEPINHSLK